MAIPVRQIAVTSSINTQNNQIIQVGGLQLYATNTIGMSIGEFRVSSDNRVVFKHATAGEVTLIDTSGNVTATISNLALGDLTDINVSDLPNQVSNVNRAGKIALVYDPLDSSWKPDIKILQYDILSPVTTLTLIHARDSLPTIKVIDTSGLRQYCEEIYPPGLEFNRVTLNFVSNFTGTVFLQF